MSARAIKWTRFLAAAVMIVAASITPRDVARAQFTSIRRDNMRFEVRPHIGAFIPTASEGDVLETTALAGLQMSLAFVPRFALTVMLSVGSSKDRIMTGDQNVDIVQSDVGAEWRPGSGQCQGPRGFTPFVGAGLGSRAYEYRERPGLATTTGDGYAALGGELGFGVVGVRVEARDYLSQFKSPTSSGRIGTRNDFMVSLGVAVRLGPFGTQQPQRDSAAIVPNE